MKKKYFVLLLSFLMLLASTSTALAKKPEDFTIKVIPDEYVYRMSTKTLSDSWDWSHEARNGVSLVGSVDKTVSRTKLASLNVTSEAEAGVVFSKVGISAEVSIGTSKTESTTVTYPIPANTRTMCMYGSALVSTTGYLDYYFNGKLSSTKYISGNWSYHSISDSYVIEYGYTGPSTY